MLSPLAICHFGLAVVLIRMQTSFAVVVSCLKLNVKQRTYSSGACATEYIAVFTRCSDQRCHLKFGAVVKLFNYLNVEDLVKYKVAIAAYVRCCSSF